MKLRLPSLMVGAAFAVLTAAACGSGAAPARAPSTPAGTAHATATPPMRDMREPNEVHLANVRQLTFGGDNAEAYWSFAGDQLIFQTNRAPYKCDQIMRMPAQYGASATQVSNGKGRTTCAYFLKGDAQVVYASTHEKSDECPTPPDMSKGYVWGLFDFDIYRSNPDGSAPVRLTDAPGYDAEATVCGKDGSIIFTSTRNGDLDLYRMDADGKNVVQLTHAPGYDGGAFFSPDCSKIVWRASRPAGAELEDYKALLAQNLVRPSKMELYVANADGTDARQITFLGVAAFAPYFHPNGKRILFSTNYPNPRGPEFDIWAINVDGSGLERITWAPGFDGFPMFSPDGKTLAFSSNRRDVVPGPNDAQGHPTEVYRVTGQPAAKRDTNVFLADWVEAAMPPAEALVKTTVDQFAADVAYLADDARGGRGVGTEGFNDALHWAEAALRDAGVSPIMPPTGPQANTNPGYRQPFFVTAGYTREAETTMRIDGVNLPTDHFAPFVFSGSGKTGKAQAPVVDVGWGIVDAATKRDDYRGKTIKGKIVRVHRFAPSTLAAGEANRLGDLRKKAFDAKQRGAIGMIVIDDGDLKAEEAKLPMLASAGSAVSDAGLPIVALTRAAAAPLVTAKSVELTVALAPIRVATDNLVGLIAAKHPQKLPGVVVIGAHLDHLGNGGPTTGSLDKATGVHNGADDNASGVAALLATARELAAQPETLQRDVVFVLFSAEEMGVLGSAHFVKHLPPAAKQIVAMLNMDMVGRMRHNNVSVLGTESAAEWRSLLTPLCQNVRLDCTLGGSGYGPSDHMPFYIAGVPVVHFFTGSHLDYHKQSDDAHTINAAGGAQVARLVAALARTVAAAPKTLTYKKVAAPPPVTADMRLSGASLGTVPAYNDEPNQPPGAAIADVVPDGPAAKAGLKGGDRIVRIAETDIRNLTDMMMVLQNHKPGDAVKVTVTRAGQRLTVEAVLGQRRR